MEAAPTRSMFRRGLEVFVENKLALVGVVLLLAIVFFCFIGPLLLPHQPGQHRPAERQPAARCGHPLGTDPDGYDVLGRLMAGGQISLELGIASAVVATVIGTLWGAVAGLLRRLGRRGHDAHRRRAAVHPDAVPAPGLATIITPTPLIMILVISLTSWLTISRLVRGEALSLRVREYVQAVKVMGGGGSRS